MTDYANYFVKGGYKMLVDTHAHLQWASFYEDQEKVIRRAREASVDYVVNIGFDLRGSTKAVELAIKHKGVFSAVGIHPHNASQYNKKVYKKLKRKLNKAEKNQDIFCVALQSLDRVDDQKLALFRNWLDKVTDFDFTVPPETSGNTD